MKLNEIVKTGEKIKFKPNVDYYCWINAVQAYANENDLSPYLGDEEYQRFKLDVNCLVKNNISDYSRKYGSTRILGKLKFLSGKIEDSVKVENADMLKCKKDDCSFKSVSIDERKTCLSKIKELIRKGKSSTTHSDLNFCVWLEEVHDFARTANLSLFLSSQSISDFKSLSSEALNACCYTNLQSGYRTKVLGKLCFLESKLEESEKKNKILIAYDYETMMKKDVEKFLEENGYETVSLNSKEFARLKRNQNDNELEFSFCIAIYTTEEEKKQMPIPKLSSLLSVPQDTIFEHGILVGRFGEDKVATIASGAKVKFPNSVNNFIYANDNSWKYKLLKQIRKAGI